MSPLLIARAFSGKIIGHWERLFQSEMLDILVDKDFCSMVTIIQTLSESV